MRTGRAHRRKSTMHAETLLRFPSFSPRFLPVWRRNLLVWRKLAVASILGNIAEPLLYMLALGYGIAYRVLDAQHFGVPQRRRRVFVVGYL